MALWAMENRRLLVAVHSGGSMPDWTNSVGIEVMAENVEEWDHSPRFSPLPSKMAPASQPLLNHGVVLRVAAVDRVICIPLNRCSSGCHSNSGPTRLPHACRVQLQRGLHGGDCFGRADQLCNDHSNHSDCSVVYQGPEVGSHLLSATAPTGWFRPPACDFAVDLHAIGLPYRW